MKNRVILTLVTVITGLLITGCQTTKSAKKEKAAVKAENVIKDGKLKSAFAVMTPIKIQDINVTNNGNTIGMTIVDSFDAKFEFLFKGKLNKDKSKRIGDIYVGNSQKVNNDSRKLKAGSMEAEQVATILNDFRKKNYNYKDNDKLWRIINAVNNQ